MQTNPHLRLVRYDPTRGFMRPRMPLPTRRHRNATRAMMVGLGVGLVVAWGAIGYMADLLAHLVNIT